MSWRTIDLINKLGNSLGLAVGGIINEGNKKQRQRQAQKSFMKFRESLAAVVPQQFSSAILSSSNYKDLSNVLRTYGISASDINAQRRIAAQRQKQNTMKQYKDPEYLFRKAKELFKKGTIAKPSITDYEDAAEYDRSMKLWGRKMGQTYGDMKYFGRKAGKQLPESWEVFYKMLIKPKNNTNNTKVTNPLKINTKKKKLLNEFD